MYYILEIELPFGVGPFITLKCGVNAASVPTGIKTVSQ